MSFRLLSRPLASSSFRPVTGIPRSPQSIRTMATVSSGISHEERTAQEPRRDALEPVRLSQIKSVNESIRLLRLSAADPKHTLKVAKSTIKVLKCRF